MDRGINAAGARGGVGGLLAAGLCIAAVLAAQGCTGGATALETPRLLAELPDYCPTPDGMAIDNEGNLVVACPNYGSYAKGATKPDKPACFIRIDRDNKVRKWFDCPVLKETARACPMGIAFGPDGDLYVCDNQNWPTGNGKDGEINQGRLLRLRVKGDKVVRTTVVASGISHPNGVRVHKGHLYVTVSMLPKIKNPDGKLASAVYRFRLSDRDVKVTNTNADKHLLVLLKTLNPDCQYGADGIVFDSRGRLYVGNFGDGALHRITFDEAGNVTGESVFAKTDFDTPMSAPEFTAKMVRARMRTTDGICADDQDNIYVADFSNNAVAKVAPDGNITVLAQNGDTDGAGGLLDQPGEPIVWGGKLVVTCFDMVTGKDKVNTKHDEPHTICVIPLGGK
ncbi:MAG: phage head-tail adapter protein [Phycisphaerae bacterium]